MQKLKAEVLVVGGGTGGTAAAIQAARRGVHTILVSEFSWLGGMLTSAGVTAPDGNELLALQTGIWGAYLQALKQRQPEGLDHAWVSFFTYDPRVGAQIFADWVAELPNLQWLSGQVPLEVLREGDRVTGVRFSDYMIEADITLDGTEIGDLLVLGNVPHRWGWELQSEWGEPSAPATLNALMQRYPVQVPTWIVVMQDYGAGTIAPEIPPPLSYDPAKFEGAWEKHGAEAFLNYGRLPGDRFMINWPHRGNDYGEGVQRLVESSANRHQFLQEARWHTQGFAHFIQTRLDRRYGLAQDIFPSDPSSLGGGAYALHPYYRESRRLEGVVTVREQDILPIPGGYVASLPIQVNGEGCTLAENICDTVAIGNYPNDHHYPSGDIDLKLKAMKWGGRWTGTPFTIPYGALVSATIDGFLVCEKNISVSHIANGATRLQPLVLGIGQAAGIAAALCIEQNCQPRELDVRSIQKALLNDPVAPAAVIPLLNLPPHHPDWNRWQNYYLEHPEAYPSNGICPVSSNQQKQPHSFQGQANVQHPISGLVKKASDGDYIVTITKSESQKNREIKLVTLDPGVAQTMNSLVQGQPVNVIGKVNESGGWLLAESLDA